MIASLDMTLPIVNGNFKRIHLEAAMFFSKDTSFIVVLQDERVRFDCRWKSNLTSQRDINLSSALDVLTTADKTKLFYSLWLH